MRNDRPKLGQNFLIDADWQKRIVNAFRPEADFAEIGPGHGELTQYLSSIGRDFTVFEKDRELVELHRARKQYRVIEGDFLDWDFSFDGQPVKNFSFIGNLPYESGTAIVKRVVERADQVSSFVFMLQQEVVDRMLARHQTRDFGSLSILVQGQFDLELIGTVPPTSFRPAPKVVSRVFRGVRRKTGAHPLDPKYHKFLMVAFSMKRKTFKNVLKSQLVASEIKSLYGHFGWIETIRAEEISVDLWPQIYRWIVDLRGGANKT